MTGLVPNGLYTIWNVTFDEGGMNPELEMLNINGIGCIGATDGSQNYFIASSTGTGHNLSPYTSAPQNLSMIGDINECPLTDETEFHVLVPLSQRSTRLVISLYVNSIVYLNMQWS